jgi:hypothetical protein
VGVAAPTLDEVPAASSADESTTPAGSAPGHQAADPWDREVYDARHDEDPFDRLGVTAEPT